MTRKPRMVRVSGELFLPSTVLAEMQAIQTTGGILFQNVLRDKTVSEELRRATVELWNSWLEYYKKNRGWLSRAVNTTYETVRDYRARFDELRRRYEAEGGKAFVPGIQRRGELESTKILGQLGAAAVVGGVLFWVLNRR